MTSTPNPRVTAALLKVESLIAAKQQHRTSRTLASILCKRFHLAADPELLIALAPDLNTHSIEDALSVWVSRQSVEPIPSLSQAGIESFATLLRHKLWRIQDDQGEIA